MQKTKIGIIGGGMIGSTLATLWARAGHDVTISSRHPDALEPLVDEIGPNARAGSVADTARWGDVIVVTVPLKAVPGVAQEIGASVAGKIVIDTNNPYPNRDGDIAHEAKGHSGGSGAWVAALFPGARVVKAFNTVYFATLRDQAHRRGAQVGIPLASDDHDAAARVAELVRDAGFDPVLVGAIAESARFDVGTPVYNTGASGPEVRRILGIS